MSDKMTLNNLDENVCTFVDSDATQNTVTTLPDQDIKEILYRTKENVYEALQ